MVRFLVTTIRTAGITTIQIIEAITAGADMGITNLQSDSITEVKLGERKVCFYCRPMDAARACTCSFLESVVDVVIHQKKQLFTNTNTLFSWVDKLLYRRMEIGENQPPEIPKRHGKCTRAIDELQWRRVYR